MWLEQWLEGRRVRSLKQKIERLKKEVEEAENNTGLPAFDGATQQIRLERIVVLEQAVERLENLKMKKPVHSAGP